jgi:hypothetical protein
MDTTNDKCDDSRDSFCEILKQVFDQFLRWAYHMYILLEDFSAKLRRKDIFKPNGNESLHANTNGNGGGTVNFITSEHL